jgi:hypothetical protein
MPDGEFEGNLRAGTGSYRDREATCWGAKVMVATRGDNTGRVSGIAA